VLRSGTGNRALTVTEQGFYEVRRPGTSEPARVIGANLDLSESDLTPMDPAEFAAAVEPRSSAPSTAPGTSPRLSPEDRERPQSIWWYLLVAAFVTLAVETALGNRLSRSGAS
jgi:hypothetical protein